MELTVKSPTSEKRIDVMWVNLTSTRGNLVIQSNHAPTVFSLESGSQVTYGLSSGKQESIDITTGMVHVTRSSVLLLTTE